MPTWRMIAVSSVVPLVAALAMALPGCGGQETNPDGSVKVAPVVNPAPGVVPLDQESPQMDTEKKKAK